MGFSVGNVHHLARLGRQGHIPKRARVLDFGSQNNYGDFPEDEGRGIFEAFGRPEKYDALLFANGTKLDRLMEALGFDYVAFDTYDEGRTRKFDFNFDSLSYFQRGKYDLVMNLGTSEHVANQFNLFKIAHDAMKIGGVFYNFVPFCGGQNHGLFNYHPKFFTTLIHNNGYEPLFWDLSNIFKANEDGYRDISKIGNGPNWEGTQTGMALMNVIFKKRHAKRFVPPTDAVLVGDVHVPAPTTNDIAAQIQPA